MNPVLFLETAVNGYHTTRRSIADDKNLHSPYSEFKVRGIKHVNIHNNQYASSSLSSRIITELHSLLNTENMNSDDGISDPLSRGNKYIYI
jgi:hypothetical protein